MYSKRSLPQQKSQNKRKEKKKTKVHQFNILSIIAKIGGRFHEFSDYFRFLLLKLFYSWIICYGNTTGNTTSPTGYKNDTAAQKVVALVFDI